MLSCKTTSPQRIHPQILARQSASVPTGKQFFPVYLNLTSVGAKRVQRVKQLSD
jgi:hypothetical protein